MSKKFSIKPPIWPREYTFIEFVKLNPQIDENQMVSLYNQYLNKYLGELNQNKIHFKQSKITQLLTELKGLQLHEVIDINTPGAGGYQNKSSITFTGNTAASGTSDFISTEFDPDAYELYNGFTVSYWVRPDELENTCFALGRKPHNNERFQFGIENADDFFVGVGKLRSRSTEHGMVADGTWYHWAITYAGEAAGLPNRRAVKVYRDGTLLQEATAVWTLTTNTGGEPVYFGGYSIDDGSGGDRYTAGWACGLDEVAIFNKVKDISTLYPDRIRKPIDLKDKSGLVGYWRFEEGSGTTAGTNVEDLSGQGNHGTLTTADTGLPTFSTNVPIDKRYK